MQLRVWRERLSILTHAAKHNLHVTLFRRSWPKIPARWMPLPNNGSISRYAGAIPKKSHAP
jgi:hypothetical protein